MEFELELGDRRRGPSVGESMGAGSPSEVSRDSRGNWGGQSPPAS